MFEICSVKAPQGSVFPENEFLLSSPSVVVAVTAFFVKQKETT